MRYCVYVLSYCKSFSSTSQQLINSVHDVCKILNTLIVGKKYSEAEIKLEKKIPEKVVEFPFSLVSAAHKETSNGAITEQNDTLSKILSSISSQEYGVGNHNYVSSLVVGKKSRSPLSFEKLIRQVRMYLIVTLKIGEHISSALSSIFNNSVNVDIRNALCGILQILAKPLVRTEQVPIQKLVNTCIQCINNQKEKFYPADMLKELAVVILKTFSNVDTCKQVLSYLLRVVSAQIIAEDVENIAKSTEFLSNYVYLLDNIQMSNSHAFSELRQELLNFHAPSYIASAKFDRLFPLPSIEYKTVCDEIEISKEMMQCSITDIFTRALISRLIIIAEASSTISITQDHYSTFIANFFLFLNHLVNNWSKTIRANVANEILDISNFSTFCKLGDDTPEFRNLCSQCLFSIASLDDECMLDVFEKINIIDISEDIFKFFVSLSLRNASRNKSVFERVWIGYIHNMKNAKQTLLSQEKMLFLALCFSTMDSTAKSLIFSEYVKLIKTELSNLKSKSLSSHVLVLFEYLCKNFDSMPINLESQLSDFFQNSEYKLKINYNSLLDKLGVRNENFFELDYEHNAELSSTAVSILKQNDNCAGLVRALLVNISQLSDSDDKVLMNTFDYNADICIRLLNPLLKLDSIKKFEATSTIVDRLSYLIQYIHNNDMNQIDHLSQIVDMIIMTSHSTDEVPTCDNSILSLVYIKECLGILEKYDSRQLDWKSETVELLLKRLCYFCSLSMQQLDSIIQRDLMYCNQMSEEEARFSVSLLRSALNKETIMTCIGLLTSSGTVKTSSANVSEWHDSKLNALKNISDILSEKSLWKFFFHHIIGSVHLSHRNLQAFSCYNTIRSNIDMIANVTSIVKDKGYSANFSSVMPDLVALLLNLREHYVYRSSLLVEPIMFNLFSEGFVNELNVYRTFTVGMVLSSLQASDLISKKPSCAHKIISACFEYLEDYILSKGKRMQSVQSLMFGEPEIPKFCTSFRFDAVVLFKILMAAADTDIDLFKLVLSFLELIISKFEVGITSLLQSLASLENIDIFLQSCFKKHETRPYLQKFLVSIHDKSGVQAFMPVFVDAMLQVLKHISKSSPSDFSMVFTSILEVIHKTTNLECHDKFFKCLNEIIQEQAEVKEIKVLSPICRFIYQQLMQKVSNEQNEKTLTVINQFKAKTKYGENIKFKGPIVQSANEIHTKMDNNEYEAYHSLLVDETSSNIDFDSITNYFKASTIESQNDMISGKSASTSIAIMDETMTCLLQLLENLKTSYESNTKELESSLSKWDLKDGSVNSYSRLLLDETSSYPTSTFNTKLTFERRQEANIFRSKPMPRHLVSSNLANTVIIAEQSDVHLLKSTSNFSDSVPRENSVNDIKIANSHSMSFKVVHVKVNPENDNFVAVAGIYECHVLVLDNELNVIQQVPLYLACEDMPSETFVIDIQWLPGEQCLLAVTTNQFVKVYDLSSDTFCPTFNFSAQNDQIVSSVFAPDPKGMKDLKTCFALTKSGKLYYQSYFNSGGEAYFSDSVDISRYSHSAEGKRVFYSELIQVLFASFADGTSIALKLDHLSGGVQSVLEISKNSELKQLGCWTHLCEIVDMCGVLVAVTSSNKSVVLNFSSDKVDYQILPNPDSHTLEGLTSIPPFGKYSSVLALFSNGELKKFMVTKDATPCCSLPPKCRISRELKKRQSSLKHFQTLDIQADDSSKQLTVSSSQVDTSLDAQPADTSSSKDITSKCSYSGDGNLTSDEIKNMNNDTNTTSLCATRVDGMKISIHKPDNIVITGIKVLLGKNNKASIPSTISSLGHSISSEKDVEKWYTINYTNEEALNMGKTLDLDISASVDKSTMPTIDGLKILGLDSGPFRYNYVKKKLEGETSTSSEKSTQNLPEEKHQFSTDEVAIIHDIAKSIIPYELAVNLKDSQKDGITSLISDCLLLPSLSELKEVFLSVLLATCDNVESFTILKTTLELDRLSKRKLTDLDESHANLIIDKYVDILFYDPDHFYNRVLSNDAGFMSSMFSLLQKNKSDEKLQTDSLVKLCTGMALIEFLKKSSEESLQQISKLLLDEDEETVRTSASQAVAKILGIVKTQSSTLAKLLTEFCSLMSKCSDSLIALNILQLISVVIIRSCSNLALDEIINIDGLVASICDKLSVSSFFKNLTPQNPASEKRILILDMLISLLSLSEETQWTSYLRQAICKTLNNIPSIHDDILSACGDALVLFVPTDHQAEYEDIMGGLLKSQKEIPTRLFSPIFSDLYISDNKTNIMAEYPRIILQSLFKLTKYLNKQSLIPEDNITKWYNFLANLAVDENEYLRSISKYYLLELSGSIGKFNKIMDDKLFATRLSDFMKPTELVSNWSPERARRIVVNVNEVVDRVVNNPINWIDFCLVNDTVLPSLLEFTFLLDESVTIPLQLLNCSFSTENKSHLEKVTSLYMSHSSRTLNRFIDFVFNGETSNIRAESAKFLSKLFTNSSIKSKEILFNIIIKRVASLPYYGRKGREFTNHLLIPIFEVYEKKRQQISDELVKCLESQNHLIGNHPNSYIYDNLQNYFSLDSKGYYLETVPCLICISPEVPSQQVVLKDITKAKKFSHSSEYVKLKNSYIIESMEINISDAKKSKMIRTVEFYFNNNQALEVHDLTKASTVWQKAGSMTVPKNSSQCNITFSVPITCCNLLIEFSSFYYDLASMDALFCSNCGIPVYDKYGLCLTCGENVFSCHKCKAINYDHLDAFVCSTCGTCKYATFEFSCLGKQVFIGDKIRNEEDCKKSLQIIDTQLNSSANKLIGLKEKSSEIKSLLISLKTGDYKGKSLTELISSLEDLYNNQTKALHEGLSNCQKIMLTTRKQLREYISSNRRSDKKYYQSDHFDVSTPQHNRCFGCANNLVSNVIDFYQSIHDCKGLSINDQLLNELFVNVSRLGMKEKALQVLTKISFIDDIVSSKVNTLLQQKIINCSKKTLKGYDVTAQLIGLVELLKRLCCDEKDPFFNSRMLMLFGILTETTLQPGASSSVIICEELIQPCLQIILKFVTYANQKCKEEPTPANVESPMTPTRAVQFGYHQWKEGEMTFDMFKANQIPKKLPRNNFEILGKDVLFKLLLNDCSSSVRDTTTKIIKCLCGNSQKEIGILQALTTLLPDAMVRGEYSSNFFSLFNTLVEKEERKVLLSSKGFLSFVCKLLKKEVVHLHHLETFSSNQSQDLSTGSSLYFLVTLLSDFLHISDILNEFKTKEEHVSTVLSSFLSLKSFVVQKTKSTTDSQSILRQLTDKLQETESDKKLFIIACIDTLKMYSDNRTALFVFEKLNSMIQPVKTEPVYKLKLTRAASQEFYFQGRLSKQQWTTKEFSKNGQPALMSDVKDKICEEMNIHSDIPFELLVNNCIIALNLPVVKVYEKVWLTRNVETNNNTPMEIVFRFQGIDGEATEDRIETLPRDDESIDIAQKSKITSVISTHGGVEVIVSYLRSITDFGSDKELAKNLLQFMLYCTYSKLNRRRFLMTDTVECLLSKCKYVFQHSEMAEIAELLLLCIKPLVKEATKMSHETGVPSSPLTSPMSPSFSSDIFSVDSANDLSPSVLGKSEQYKISQKEILEQLKMFLERLPVCSSKIVSAVQSLLPFLTYGLEESMDYLIQYFEPYLNFDSFGNTTKEKFYLDSFVNVVLSIPNDFAGNNLKSMILNKGITKKAIDFIMKNFDLKNTSSWKSTLSLPIIPFILNLLQGLVSYHLPSLTAMNNVDLLTVLHKIEENTDEKIVATLAESLLNTIAEGSSQIKPTIDNLRKSTKEKKKKKALSKREKTLQELKKPAISAFNFDDIEEDKGIICSICGDGYAYKPEEVIGTYVFCKHVFLTDNSGAISSVTHFNTIHTSCHSQAVVADQNRNPPKSEWEGSLIRNSFTKCNALFPFKGPKTSTSNYATAVKKFWSDVKIVKNISRDHFDILSHDLMILFNKFAKEESFSKDAGGGSAIHQVKLIPFMIQMGLYLLDTLNKNRETYETILTSFLNTDIETNLDVENISYNTILSLYLMTLEEWNYYKNIVLKRFITTTRNLKQDHTEWFQLVRPALIFVSLIDIYQKALKPNSKLTLKTDSIQIRHASSEQWIQDLLHKIENIDQEQLSKLEGIATLYTNKLLKFTTLEEFEKQMASSDFTL